MGKDIHHNIIFNLELLLKVKKTMSPSMGEWAMQQGDVKYILKSALIVGLWWALREDGLLLEGRLSFLL